jgi:hypothetical protein
MAKRLGERPLTRQEISARATARRLRERRRVAVIVARRLARFTADRKKPGAG